MKPVVWSRPQSPASGPFKLDECRIVSDTCGLDCFLGEKWFYKFFIRVDLNFGKWANNVV